MNRWQIGDVRVTRIVELEATGGSKFILPDATREACQELPWMYPHFMDEQGNLKMSVHALVVETPDRCVVVDTCIGNDKERSVPAWSQLQTTFLDDFAAAGFDRHRVDFVMCTHLHVDHVGWNTMLVDGEWLPTFPNARYLVAEKEWRYWDAQGEDEVYGPVLADSVRPIVAAGLMDFVATDFQLCPEVGLQSTPGHTPGHVSVRIESRGQTALITGDCIHHPCQMSKTHWCSSADYDQAQGEATRKDLLQQTVDSDVLIIGTHFATPTAGHVKHLPEGGFWLDVGAG